ncbi:acetylornithine deacetylase [Azospirillum sp. TSA6c]|uniref:acetylornithine deacetylase n=1 Tax=unclassified Azospirillum TaxID=2630922 RepID=UPI000D65B137|nr:acetylornithine deacetylase [Azospirillum sp. TSA6c]
MKIAENETGRIPTAPLLPTGAGPRDQADCLGRTGPGETAIDWIGRLIAFDTTSRNSNLGLIEEVRDRLSGLGFVCRTTHDRSGAKANLLASLPTGDGRLDGGLCLSGHVDTVPVDGQTWSSDPFSADIRQDRLYGRGACDMKGFVGTAIAVAVAHADRSLAAPIHLALSYDEEVGCLGAPALVEDIVAQGLIPDGCIVGEPTMMQVVNAHKGANVARCRVGGLARHSSLAPEGINAIEYAARLIVHIQSIAGRFATEGPFSEGFNVPFTTLQTGLVTGGIAVNTVPADCDFTFEFRNLPGVPADAIFREIEDHALGRLLPEMRTRNACGCITLERLASAPAFEAEDGSPFTRLVRELTGDHMGRKVAYGTEAGIFHQAGIPTLVCGPGDIAQAHRADEFVDLAQIRRCERVLTELVARMCGAVAGSPISAPSQDPAPTASGTGDGRRMIG